ncbi:MAG: stage III sporulation protein AF [Lachnospiraceae bacterium]|nr:stage III sporulation protein AF [Lachnospiraceae bacterium]
MEELFSWIRSGLLFAVFSSTILLLSPNKSYEKHISLVVGLLFILVMFHPVMTILDIDEKTYVDYIRNYLSLEQSGDTLSAGGCRLYEESVKTQLEGILKEAGYKVKSLQVHSDESGTIYKIEISFEDEVYALDDLETYLYNSFGKGVLIVYE